MHRLILQLLDIGLPVDPFWRRDGGLAFDLLSSYSEGKRVTIGHANGVITIDLVESLDAYRESLRVRLGEPYRTMLGHFRHEVGHYYQHSLVETGSGAARYLDDCRALFGDERADKVRFAVPRDIVPLESYDDAPIERLLFDWQWLSLFFNRVNTAMGKNPLYPFTIPPPVVAKLGFIHRVAHESADHRGHEES
jgi:hypothetical protein